MTPADIEAIERATISAVSPQALEEIPGWLLPFDPGTVGRAKSAVPISQAALHPAVLREIEGRYAARGLAAVFRIPCVASFDVFCDALERSAEQPTQVHTGATSVVRRVSSQAAGRYRARAR